VKREPKRKAESGKPKPESSAVSEADRKIDISMREHAVGKSRLTPLCPAARSRLSAFRFPLFPRRFPLSAIAALADQGTASAANFLTGVIVGRLCGSSEYGLYAAAYSLVVLVLQVQTSLVTAPYTVFTHRLRGETARRYTGTALVYAAALAAAAMLGLAIGAGVLSCGLGPAGLAPVVWVVAAAVGFHLLREFGRQIAFAHLHPGRALAMDIAVAALQLGAIACLVAAEILTAFSAHIALGIACGVSVVWLVAARGKFRVCLRETPQTIGPHWRFGRWIFAALVAQAGYVIVLQWALGWAADDWAAAGLFSACMMVVVVTNPLVLGASNILSPQSARAMAHGGEAAVGRVVVRGTLWVGAAMAAFCGVMFVWGDSIVVLFYGPKYAGHGDAIRMMSLAVVLSGLGLAATHGLAAMQRSDLIFRARFFGLLTVVAASLMLVKPLGVLGAAYAYLAGSAVDAATMVVGYRSRSSAKQVAGDGWRVAGGAWRETEAATRLAADAGLVAGSEERGAASAPSRLPTVHLPPPATHHPSSSPADAEVTP
jgi:O-antigen/teichoic acid export membrane protein